MHVGCGTAELAQPRRLKGVLHFRQPQHRATSTVIAREPDVVEGVVGEGEAAVAVGALRLAGEEPEAGDLALGQGLRIARDPAVEARHRRDERALIGRDRLGEIGGVDLGRLGEGVREGFDHGGIGLQALDHRRKRLRHLVGRLDRPRDLLLEAPRAPVPEHRRSPGQIPQGGRVTLKRAARDALPVRLAVGEALVALVAAFAGEAPIGRQPPVMKQRIAQRAFLLRERIIGRERHAVGAAEGNLERSEIISNARRRRLQHVRAEHDRRAGTQ